MQLYRIYKKVSKINANVDTFISLFLTTFYIFCLQVLCGQPQWQLGQHVFKTVRNYNNFDTNRLGNMLQHCCI